MTKRKDDCPTGIMRVRNAVAPLDKFLRGVSRGLEFHKDPGTGTIVVSVRDLTTGAVIRQIPPVEELRSSGNLPRKGE
jgi:uncharacterized FlaG/YvyC family protein